MVAELALTDEKVTDRLMRHALAFRKCETADKGALQKVVEPLVIAMDEIYEVADWFLSEYPGQKREMILADMIAGECKVDGRKIVVV